MAKLCLAELCLAELCLAELCLAELLLVFFEGLHLDFPGTVELGEGAGEVTGGEWVGVEHGVSTVGLGDVNVGDSAIGADVECPAGVNVELQPGAIFFEDQSDIGEDDAGGACFVAWEVRIGKIAEELFGRLKPKPVGDALSNAPGQALPFVVALLSGGFDELVITQGVVPAVVVQKTSGDVQVGDTQAAGFIDGLAKDMSFHEAVRSTIAAHEVWKWQAEGRLNDGERFQKSEPAGLMIAQELVKSSVRFVQKILPVK